MSKKLKKIWTLHEAFDPHEIEVLHVVFQNLRAAIGDPVAREVVAARLFSFAMRGERDPAKLYLKTIDSYQAAQSCTTSRVLRGWLGAEALLPERRNSLPTIDVGLPETGDTPT